MAVSEQLVLAEGPDLTTVSKAVIVVDRDAATMVAGRKLIIGGETARRRQTVGVVELASAKALPAGRTELTLVAAPEVPFIRATAVVFGNVARATHGETVTQVLGSGDSRQPFASFGLQQGPLTFVPADNPRGTASSLEVRVDGVRWSELTSTYTAEPADRVFVTRDEPDGTVSVVFGDGERGARPTSVRTTCARPTARASEPPATSSPKHSRQAVDRPLGLKAVTNPGAATGGADPEVEGHARVSIPLPVRTLGRAVSLLDYADFALAFTGIGKSSAAVLTLAGGRTIVVTVLTEDGSVPPLATRQRLEGELRRSGDPHVRVLVVAGRLAPFKLALKVRVETDRVTKDVLAAVEQHLRIEYAAAERELGQPVHRSAVIASAATRPRRGRDRPGSALPRTPQPWRPDWSPIQPPWPPRLRSAPNCCTCHPTRSTG